MIYWLMQYISRPGGLWRASKDMIISLVVWVNWGNVTTLERLFFKVVFWCLVARMCGWMFVDFKSRGSHVQLKPKTCWLMYTSSYCDVPPSLPSPSPLLPFFPPPVLPLLHTFSPSSLPLSSPPLLFPPSSRTTSASVYCSYQLSQLLGHHQPQWR